MHMYIKLYPEGEIELAMKRVNEARRNLHEALENLGEVCEALSIECTHELRPKVSLEDIATGAISNARINACRTPTSHIESAVIRSIDPNE